MPASHSINPNTRTSVVEQASHPVNRFRHHEAEEFQILQRQLSVKEFLLCEHLGGMLSCIQELLQYRSPLTCAPYICGGLLNPHWERMNQQKTTEHILSEAQREWEMIICMESQEDSSNLLQKMTPQCRWQSYRETLTCLEMADWQVTDRVRGILQAYLPKINGSANVEDSFNSMEDCVRRSGKSDSGSLPNMQAVHMRATKKNMCGQRNQGQSIELHAGDFEGAEVRGIRPKLFSPSSYNRSDSKSILDQISIETNLKKYPPCNFLVDVSKRYTNRVLKAIDPN